MKLQSTGNKCHNDDKPIAINLNNENDLRELLGIIQQLQERAAKIATSMVKLKGGKTSIDAEDIRFENGAIVTEYEEYLGCGDWDIHGINIPLSYFFDENYLDDAKEMIRKMEEEKKRKAEEDAARRKKEAEERERKKYLELKAKFEGGG